MAKPAEKPAEKSTALVPVELRSLERVSYDCRVVDGMMDTIRTQIGIGDIDVRNLGQSVVKGEISMYESHVPFEALVEAEKYPTVKKFYRTLSDELASVAFKEIKQKEAEIRTKAGDCISDISIYGRWISYKVDIRKHGQAEARKQVVAFEAVCKRYIRKALQGVLAVPLLLREIKEQLEFVISMTGELDLTPVVKKVEKIRATIETPEIKEQYMQLLNNGLRLLLCHPDNADVFGRSGVNKPAVMLDLLSSADSVVLNRCLGLFRPGRTENDPDEISVAISKYGKPELRSFDEVLVTLAQQFAYYQCHFLDSKKDMDSPRPDFTHSALAARNLQILRAAKFDVSIDECGDVTGVKLIAADVDTKSRLVILESGVGVSTALPKPGRSQAALTRRNAETADVQEFLPTISPKERLFETLVNLYANPFNRQKYVVGRGNDVIWIALDNISDDARLKALIPEIERELTKARYSGYRISFVPQDDYVSRLEINISNLTRRGA